MNFKKIGSEEVLNGLGFVYEDKVRASAFLHTYIKKPFLSITNIKRLKLGARDIGFSTDDLLIETNDDKKYLLQMKKSLENSPEDFYKSLEKAYKDHRANIDKIQFYYIVSSKLDKSSSIFNRIILAKIKDLNYKDYKKVIFPDNALEIKSKIYDRLQKDNHDITITDINFFDFLKKIKCCEITLDENDFIDSDYHILESLTSFQTYTEFVNYYRLVIGIIIDKKKNSSYLNEEEIIIESEKIGIAKTLKNENLKDAILDLEDYLKINKDYDLKFADLDNYIKIIKKQLSKTNINNSVTIYFNYFFKNIDDYIKKIKLDIEYITENKYLNRKENIFLDSNYFIEFHDQNYCPRQDFESLKNDSVEASMERKAMKTNLLQKLPANILSTSINFYQEKLYQTYLKSLLSLLIKIYKNTDLLMNFSNYCSCKDLECPYFKRLLEMKELIESLLLEEVFILLTYSNEKFRIFSEMLFLYTNLRIKVFEKLRSAHTLLLSTKNVDILTLSFNLILMHSSYFFNQSENIINMINSFMNFYIEDIKKIKKASEVFQFEKNVEGENIKIEITQYDYIHEISYMFYLVLSNQFCDKNEKCLMQNRLILKHFNHQIQFY